MSNVTKLLKNTLYLTVADFLSPFVNVILVIYVSRSLGSEGLGAYTAIVAFVFLIEKLAQLGLHQIIVRDIARDPKYANKYLIDAITIGIVSSLFSYFILDIALKFIQYPPEITASIKVLGLSIFFFVMREYFFAFYEGFQRMEFKSIVSVFLTIFRTGLGVLVIYLGKGVAELIWALVLTRMLVFFISFLFVFRLGLRLSEKPDVKHILKLISQTMTFLMISLVTTTYWKVDILMLTKMKGIDDVGFYSAAYRLLDILKGLMSCYIAALFPMLAISFGTSKATFNKQLSLSIKYLYMITFPIAVGATLLGEPIIYLIYGSTFYQSVFTLKILIWTICFFPIAIIFARALVASNNQKYDLFCNILALFLNLILNYYLIHKYSFVGAAMATSISILFFLILQYTFVRKKVVKLPFLKELIRPTLAAIGMGGILMLIQSQALYLTIPIGMVSYFLILIVLHTFDDEEIKFAKSLIRRKKKIANQ